MQAPGTLYVSKLEGSSGNHSGGPCLLITVAKLWHKNSSGKDDMAPEKRQVLSGDRDADADVYCGDIPEVRGDELQLV